MSNDPDLRPSVGDVLKLDWFSSLANSDDSLLSPGDVIEQLRKDLAIAKKEIEVLKERNARLTVIKVAGSE